MTTLRRRPDYRRVSALYNYMLKGYSSHSTPNPLFQVHYQKRKGQENE